MSKSEIAIQYNDTYHTHFKELFYTIF